MCIWYVYICVCVYVYMYIYMCVCICVYMCILCGTKCITRNACFVLVPDDKKSFSLASHSRKYATIFYDRGKLAHALNGDSQQVAGE